MRQRIQQENFQNRTPKSAAAQFTFCRFGPAQEKFFPQQIVDSVLFHNLSGQIDSSMHRLRSAASLNRQSRQAQSLRPAHRIWHLTICCTPACLSPVPCATLSASACCAAVLCWLSVPGRGGAAVLGPALRTVGPMSDAPAPAAAPPRLLEALTDELLRLVLGHLEDAADLARTSAVCRCLAEIAADDSLWLSLCHRAWSDKQHVHAFAAKLRRGEARRAYVLALEEVCSGGGAALAAHTAWFSRLCSRGNDDPSSPARAELPTVCTLQWRMRFTYQAGGVNMSASSECKFKVVGEDGATATRGMLELRGYPDLVWEFRRIEHAEGSAETVMMIHNFPPHHIFRRAHTPRTLWFGEPGQPQERGAPPRQPRRHSGSWGWVIRNDNVMFWTHDAALHAAAAACKDAGNARYRGGAYAAARREYGRCLQLLGANPLGCSHEEWRQAVCRAVPTQASPVRPLEPIALRLPAAGCRLGANVSTVWDRGVVDGLECVGVGMGRSQD
jgi:hypothetical protein